MKQRQQAKKCNKTRRAIPLLLSLGVLIACGCSGSGKAPSAPAAAPQPVQKTVTAPTGTMPEEQQKPVYSYNPIGRRDPFASIIVREEKKALNRPPLERYNIFEFKLSGIVWGGFGYNAILEAPDGKGYFVHTGTIIGPNRGVVKKIMQNSMVIEETFKTYSGETDHREIVVELRKKQEGTP